MEYKAKVGIRMLIDSPGELYNNFISIVAGLSADVVKWPLPLCNTYFPAFIVLLQNKIGDNNFCMPPLHGLTTKTLQLGSLRLLRSAAVTSFELLNDE